MAKWKQGAVNSIVDIHTVEFLVYSKPGLLA